MLPRWHVLLCVHMAEGQKMPSYFPWALLWGH
jgi:hypothetical protein